MSAGSLITGSFGTNFPMAKLGITSNMGVPWESMLQSYGQITSSENAADAQKFAAARQAYAGEQEAKLGLKGTQATAAAQLASAQAAAEAQKYGANQQLAGINAQLGYKKSVFDTVYPNLLNQFNTISNKGTDGGVEEVGQPKGYASSLKDLGGGGGGGSYGYGASGHDQANFAQIIGAPAGSVAPPPTFKDAPVIKDYVQPDFHQANLIDPQSMPVISQGLLSQQINNALGSNAQQAATAIRQSGQTLGGRGLGSHSPLAQGMQNQIRASQLGANSQASLTAQNNAAQQNAAYAQAMNQALIGQAANVYGSQTQGALGAYQNLNSTNAQEYASQLQALMSGYGTQVGAQTSQENARRQAAAGAYGSLLGYKGQIGSSQNAANASIYGTNVGYQRDIQAAQIQAAASKQNALLQSLASFANA